MPGQEHMARPRIVAGVDGSPSSMSALRWAVRQAGLTSAAVDAVIAWHYPVVASGYGWPARDTPRSASCAECSPCPRTPIRLATNARVMSARCAPLMASRGETARLATGDPRVPAPGPCTTGALEKPPFVREK
jgi:hypothetical protein